MKEKIFKSKLALASLINLVVTVWFCMFLIVAHYIVCIYKPAMLAFPIAAIVGALVGQGTGTMAASIFRAAWESSAVLKATK